MSLQEDTRKALDRWYLGGDNASEVVMYAENLVKRLNEIESALRAIANKHFAEGLAQEMQGIARAAIQDKLLPDDSVKPPQYKVIDRYDVEWYPSNECLKREQTGE